MTKYTVTGGVPLRGTVKLHGAKNVGFKVMIAALLGDSPSTICDLGLISEIDFTKQVIAQLGGQVSEEGGPHCLIIDPQNLNLAAVEKDLSAKSRFSIMYVGPLLARFGQVDLPSPGGDTSIGRRPIDRHLDGLKALGVTVEFSDGVYHFAAKNGLSGGTYRFPKSTHNGTEVLVVAAARAHGTVILENAAQEPEVDDLITFLNAMGAKITRVEPRTIEIIGQKILHGAKHTVMRDRNEAVTYACAALATNGDIFVEGADEKVLTAFLEKVTAVGGGVEKKTNGLRFYRQTSLVATDVVTAPAPGFMTDWQPLWSTLMTQAQGESLVHETIYERRFDFVAGLASMGAKIEFFHPEVKNPEEFYSFNLEDDDPANYHAIKIHGSTPLSGTTLEINDVRSGATALLAGTIASGVTTILDPKDQIKRGYEDLAGGLASLGAKITIDS
ncbi:UDP-N-acetylglucosamine 1-carboxyvinyltransferase [Candidatus Microgenomates bacterium]|nr:UDP-N-acetylglucosamine 1-carboxyvinyltransferase [Candidatus Microgenomates bacterium]